MTATMVFGEVLKALMRTPRGMLSFSCYDLETAVGVLSASEDVGAPVTLLVSEAAAASAGGRHLMVALVAVARQSAQPAFVQLDHCSDLVLMREALDVGVHAVMADGSKLPYAENARFTQVAVTLCRKYGVAVEGELGRIGGDEDRDLGGRAAQMTDVDAARRFVDDTGVDCLAVAVGNVHGRYRGEPKLDLDRLRELVAATAVPVSLHGTSGLPAGQVMGALEAGVVKLNVNTELRARRFAGLSDELPRRTATLDVLALNAALAAGAKQVACRMLQLVGEGASRAKPSAEEEAMGQTFSID